MIAIAALSTVARLINVPYPILLVVGGVVLGVLPGPAGGRARPRPRPRPVPAAAALRSGLLRRPPRPAGPPAADLDARDRARGGHGLRRRADRAHADRRACPGARPSRSVPSSPRPIPLAAAAIARSQGAPRQIINIVEGESLINDGTALVIYRAAVAAVVAGSFSLLEYERRVLPRRHRRRSRSASPSAGRSRRSASGSTIRRSRSRSRWRPASPPTSLPSSSGSPACWRRSPRASISAGVRRRSRARTCACRDVPVWELLAVPAQRGPLHPHRAAASDRRRRAGPATRRGAGWPTRRSSTPR